MHTPDHIDVSSLPAPIANGLAVLVEQMTRELHAAKPPQKPKDDATFDLPVLTGTVIGNLTREEMYDDR